MLLPLLALDRVPRTGEIPDVATPLRASPDCTGLGSRGRLRRLTQTERCYLLVKEPRASLRRAGQMRQVDRVTMILAPLRRDGEARRWYSEGAVGCVVLTRR